MKRRLMIYGEVHDVGYRPFLLGIAESLEIERFFADNVIEDGRKAVVVLVDSTPEKVEEFIEMVRLKQPGRAKVESVRVEEYAGRVMGTENYYRYLTAMQLSKIATYGGKMLEKQDEMLSKQDEHIKISRETLEVAKETRDIAKETLEVSKETLEVSKETLEVAKETRDIAKETLEVSKETLEVSKETLEVAKETRDIAKESLSVSREMLKKQDETADLVGEILHGVREGSARGEEALLVLKSVYGKLHSLKTEEEIRKLRQELQELKEAIRRAGIEV